MPTKKTQRAVQARGARQPRSCSVPKCGRATFAKGLCQTHHRQLLTKGTISPIRPYQKRRPGTVKLAGHRVAPETAELLREYAGERQMSLGAVIAEIAHEWAIKKRGRKK